MPERVGLKTFKGTTHRPPVIAWMEDIEKKMAGNHSDAQLVPWMTDSRQYER